MYDGHVKTDSFVMDHNKITLAHIRPS